MNGRADGRRGLLRYGLTRTYRPATSGREARSGLPRRDYETLENVREYVHDIRIVDWLICDEGQS